MKTKTTSFIILIIEIALTSCWKSEKDDPKTQVINQVKKLTASDGADTDLFGMEVSISGDYAIVGACLNNIKGASYLYRMEWQ